MKCLRSILTTSIVALTITLLSLTPVHAWPPGGNGGGGSGGSGGGGGDPAPSILFGPLGAAGSPKDINDLREVVGTVLTQSGHQAAAYWAVVESNAVIVSNLTVLSDGYSAYGINNSAEIVGESSDSFGNTVAVYWPNPSSAAIELPPLPDHEVSLATSINNDGLICGFVAKNLLDENGEPIPGTHDLLSERAVVWRVAFPSETPVFSGPLELPADGDGSGSAAHALNDSDESGIAQVVGYQRSPVSGEGGGFLWEVQSLADGAVAVVTVPIGDGFPTGINNSGSICGRLLGRSEVDALVWSGGTVSFLDRGRGKKRVPYARAWGIGDSGIIVGEAAQHELFFDSRACFWDGIDGSLTYLDAYLAAGSTIELYSANAVNASGDIVGVSSAGPFIAIPVSQ